MRMVNELAQIVRGSVKMRRGEKIDSVVTPAKGAGEIGDRHHLNHGDSDPRELGQLPGRRLPGSLRREGAGVHFVDDLAFEFPPAPLRIGPLKLRWIDNAGGTVRTIRLKTRRGVGM